MGGDSGFSPSEESAPLAPNLDPMRGPYNLDPDQGRCVRLAVCLLSCRLPT